MMHREEALAAMTPEDRESTIAKLSRIEKK